MSCHSQIKPAISKAPDFKIYKTQEETFHASTHILMRVISVQHERYIFRTQKHCLNLRIKIDYIENTRLQDVLRYLGGKKGFTANYGNNIWQEELNGSIEEIAQLCCKEFQLSPQKEK